MQRQGLICGAGPGAQESSSGTETFDKFRRVFYITHVLALGWSRSGGAKKNVQWA